MTYKDGVLEIRMPRPSAEAASRRIRFNAVDGPRRVALSDRRDSVIAFQAGGDFGPAARVSFGPCVGPGEPRQLDHPKEVDHDYR